MALHPGLNLVTGANGAGKTSLLEAIYLLGRGHSFRTRLTERLIDRQREAFQVVGRVASQSLAQLPTTEALQGFAELPPIVVGLAQRRGEALEARVGGQPARSLAALAEVFPVQIIDPGIHRLVEEGPVYRRRWLDWGVFHVEPSFAWAWQEYRRALQQRNAALKGQADPTPWEPALIRAGEIITEARTRTLERLQAVWPQTLAALEAEPVSLSFQRGWPQGLSLVESLDQHRDRDIERGTTLTGPHRFEVSVRIGNRAGRDVLSRGQQKLVGAALALGLAREVGTARGQAPVLLLDDPAAELDALHTEALIRAVRGWQGQLVVTALERAPAALGPPERAFHVEHGRVTTL
ncbi:MAG: hypothetical protein RL684_2816 [Pseudomonadota bacterium]